MRRLLVVLLVLLAVPAGAQAASIVRVSTDQPGVLARLGFDVTENVRPGTVDVVLYSAADRRRLVATGYPFRTLPAVRARAAAGGRSALPSGRTAYRHYNDYVNELSALATGHPGLARSVTLPKKTVLGEPIVGVEIAADVNRTDDGRPVYVVMGDHHAREWPSAEAAMEFATDLVRGYGTDARITSLLDRERVYVIPVVNVDGFKISRGNIRSSADDPVAQQTANAGDMKRKNCAAD